MVIPLPQYYFDWLKGLKDAYCVEFDDRCWFISTIEELQEEVDIDKRSMPFWQQLVSLADMFVELSNVDSTTDQDGNPVSVERLKGCVVIGDDNGDPLYVDPSNGYSVWCYYLDGGDVASVCSSLEGFIGGSVVVPE